MRKVVFFSVIAFVLMGCGGGSGADTAAAQKISPDQNRNTSLSQDTNTTQDASSTQNASAKSTPDADQSSQAVTSDTSNIYPAPFLSDEEKKVLLAAINTARAEGQDCGKIDSHGIPVKDSNGRYIYDGSNIMAPTTALTWSDALYAAAYEHSSDLAESDTASHSGSGTASDATGMDLGGRKSTFVDRARNNGYQFSRLGENISMGTHRDTIQKAVDSWLKSPGHCVNLMNPLYTEVGVGHVEKADTTYTHYWTQVLGTPAN